MWKKIPECRKHKYCPLMEKSEEHLVYLIFDYHEGGEPLLLTNERFMTVEMALNIIRMEMGMAVKLEKNKLKIVFRGGDPFKRFHDLRKICEESWKLGTENNVDVRFELAVRPENFTDKSGEWYIEHYEKVFMWIFCETYASDIVEVSKNLGCGIIYYFNPKKLKESILQLLDIQSEQIPVKIHIIESPEEWTIETSRQYERMGDEVLKYAKNVYSFPWADDLIRIANAKYDISGDMMYGRCYDPNGFQWICPALSQLNHYSWNMKDEKLQEIIEQEPEAAMKWVCPGELLKWRDKHIFLKDKKLMEYCWGMQIVKRFRDMGINEVMKELSNEARKK